MIDQSNMNSIEFFKNKFQEVSHGDSSYMTHCFGIYNILKNIGCTEDVCIAGLYHSVYGTNNFSISNSVTRDEIKTVIGTYPEKLVSIFCSLTNRANSILNNTLDLNYNVRHDLCCIEYANTVEQLSRLGSHLELENIRDLLLQQINLYKNFNPKFETISINDKNIFVFDGLLENSQIEWINEYCLNSKYTPEHRSNGLNYETDSRFACTLNDEELKNTNLLPAIWKAAQLVNLKFNIAHAYINHYAISTSVSKHCDASNESYTVLIFCNKFWESVWGGEISFYNETSASHSMIEFKPGRIIIFDSRIAHKVLPMTFSAKKDRYSIALKCKLIER